MNNLIKKDLKKRDLIIRLGQKKILKFFVKHLQYRFDYDKLKELSVLKRVSDNMFQRF